MSKRILVTAALPYANGPLHLGHLAGAYLPSDLYVRYKRLKGDEVVFICGSDEHGVPITIAADKEGVTPQDIVDRYHAINKKAFEDFGISFDYYGRTSSETHKRISQDFFKTLHNKGVFTRKKEEQFFDVSAGMFLADRYIKGTCPKCGYEEAYGDQCEKCGASLSPSELINPVSMLSGETPELRETEHWYIPLGNYQEWLAKWIDEKTDWKPNVTGQCKSWLDAGLNERAVTRDLKWGVPVPLDDAEGKVLYVWFDAPIGYISATVEWAAQIGDPEGWKMFWQDEDTELIHFIGKDNIVFHCIMFPAMLKAHGDYVLPKNVPANEFLNLEGKKLSTSRGWAVWLHEYLEDFEPDLLRYALTTSLPETKDSDFVWKEFQGKVNNDLADVFGNFVFRTFSFIHRFFDSRIPELKNPNKQDLDLLDEIEKHAKLISASYEKFRFKDAASHTINLARLGNRYFTEKEPWHSRKNNLEDCANTLHVCAQITAALSVFFSPIIPDACDRLQKALNLEINGLLLWEEAHKNMLKASSVVEEMEILFKKVEDDIIEKQLQKLLEKSSSVSAAGNDAGDKSYEPLRDIITYDDFAKLDFRTGIILKAEKMKKSKKLLRIEVDLGFEKRTVLSGIAEFYKPEELSGQKVVVVANLAPRKMMGTESEGMILMAENPDGGLRFVESDAEPGALLS
ncbi:MAG: methionine--tRNA ligase [Balneolales bacterium]|nr:methionine--tRNA ligase [Balneolales bacterium]